MTPITIPIVLFENVIFCYLEPKELGICSSINRTWQQMVKKHLDMFSPPGSFGAKDWYTHFGCRVKNIPRCPPCIIQRWSELQKDHVLVLIPNSVNDKVLTLKRMGKLVKNPLQGHKAHYDLFDTGMYEPEAAPSHWALFTRTVIQGSLCNKHDESQAFVTDYSQKIGFVYEIPTVLDAVVCNLVEYVRTGTWLNSLFHPSFTWCQEKYNSSSHLVVGRRDKDGLCVDCDFGDSDPDVGVHGLLRTINAEQRREETQRREAQEQAYDERTAAQQRERQHRIALQQQHRIALQQQQHRIAVQQQQQRIVAQQERIKPKANLTPAQRAAALRAAAS